MCSTQKMYLRNTKSTKNKITSLVEIRKLYTYIFYESIILMGINGIFFYCTRYVKTKINEVNVGRHYIYVILLQFRYFCPYKIDLTLSVFLLAISQTWRKHSITGQPTVNKHKLYSFILYFYYLHLKLQPVLS